MLYKILCNSKSHDTWLQSVSKSPLKQLWPVSVFSFLFFFFFVFLLNTKALCLPKHPTHSTQATVTIDEPIRTPSSVAVRQQKGGKGALAYLPSSASIASIVAEEKKGKGEGGYKTSERGEQSRLNMSINKVNEQQKEPKCTCNSIPTQRVTLR